MTTDVTDVDAILDSGSLEDIDKLLSAMDGAEEDPASVADESGDTATDTPSADPAPGQIEPTTQEAKPAETAAPAAAADEPPVLLAKDGKNHIPYTVLEAERRQNAEYQAQIQELSRRSELLELQLKEANIAPKDLPENVRFTPEQLKELEDFGDIGSAVAILAQQNALMMQRLEAVGSPAPQAQTQTDSNPFAQNPDTLRWAESDAHWAVVETVNGVLDADPAWMGKSASERIPEIVRRTKLALGEPSDADINATADAAIKAAERTAPNSLTDVGGAVLGQEKTVVERLEEGTTHDVEAYLAKQLAAGKSMDDVLNALLV